MQLFGTAGQAKLIVPGQRDNGTEVPSMSRDKGTTGQAQNLATGRDGPGQPKSGTGRGTKRDRAEKDVLKQEKGLLKQGHPGTGQPVKNPVPSRGKILSLSRCPFVPGQ